MNRLTRLLLPLGAALAVTACGAAPTTTFDVRAINFDGIAVPCLVEVDSKFSEAQTAARYTDCEIPVLFSKPRMKVKVYPTRVDAQGKIVPPDPTATTEYYSEIRELTAADPRVHLFILRTNPNYSGN